MDKAQLQELVDSGLSCRQIADKLGKTRACVNYWLIKHGIFTKFKHKGNRLERKCHQCGEMNPEKFYPSLARRCKECQAPRMVDVKREIKRRCVEYKGGKCEICGYSKSLAAFDFHHIDPSQKDIEWSKLKRSRNFESIKSEIDKCMLLCSNCHREIHWPEPYKEADVQV